MTFVVLKISLLDNPMLKQGLNALRPQQSESCPYTPRDSKVRLGSGARIRQMRKLPVAMI